MQKHHPDVFLHLGDWTYPSYQLPSNYPEDWSMVELSYRKRYEEINMREMLRDLPVDYVYDDDDFTEGGSTRRNGERKRSMSRSWRIGSTPEMPSR